jgi:hypothetical protein
MRHVESGPEELATAGLEFEWARLGKGRQPSQTYCGWPARGRTTFPHHLNKFSICYRTNLRDNHMDSVECIVTSARSPKAALS